uniref:Uncharacterized protein n=1 Tax=Anguilla anguilla TaxID=7936 RepID=A0A0E9UWL6_ANGAN
MMFQGRKTGEFWQLCLHTIMCGISIATSGGPIYI